jgi:hypothetical protein
MWRMAFAASLFQRGKDATPDNGQKPRFVSVRACQIALDERFCSELPGAEAVNPDAQLAVECAARPGLSRIVLSSEKSPQVDWPIQYPASASHPLADIHNRRSQSHHWHDWHAHNSRILTLPASFG